MRGPTIMNSDTQKRYFAVFSINTFHWKALAQGRTDQVNTKNRRNQLNGCYFSTVSNSDMLCSWEGNRGPGRMQ